MNQTLFLTIYITLLTIEYLTLTTLTILNMNSVIKNRNDIPKLFSGIISKENYTNNVKYTLTKEHFSILHLTLSTITTALLLLTGVLGMVENYLRMMTTDKIILGLLFVATVSVLLAIIELPFSLYSTFVIEERYGFNKMTFKSLLSDMTKQIILSAILGGIILSALFLFMDKTGDVWWLWSSLFFISFQLILLIIYPSLIAPIFNKFSPLEDGELKNELEELSNKANFKISGIFIMDGSKRSGHSNAYFTGIGKNRRIVLYDTLIESLSTNELCSVLAHEIGHWKKGHITKRILTTFLTVPVIFYILSLAIGYTPLYSSFGMIPGTYHGLLIILTMISGPFTILITPISNYISRKHEFEADNFAMEILGNKCELTSALISLSKENLSNLTPHPSYSAFHYSHPPVAERIKKLNNNI